TRAELLEHHLDVLGVPRDTHVGVVALRYRGTALRETLEPTSLVRSSDGRLARQQDQQETLGWRCACVDERAVRRPRPFDRDRLPRNVEEPAQNRVSGLGYGAPTPVAGGAGHGDRLTSAGRASVASTERSTDTPCSCHRRRSSPSARPPLDRRPA